MLGGTLRPIETQAEPAVFVLTVVWSVGLHWVCCLALVWFVVGFTVVKCFFQGSRRFTVVFLGLYLKQNVFSGFTGLLSHPSQQVFVIMLHLFSSLCRLEKSKSDTCHG